MKNELLIPLIDSPSVLNELQANQISYESEEVPTGVYSEPYLRLNFNQKVEYEKARNVIEKYGLEKAPITEKKLWLRVFLFTFNLIGLLFGIFISVKVVHFALFEYSGGAEIWVTLIIGLPLIFLAMYFTCKEMLGTLKKTEPNSTLKGKC